MKKEVANLIRINSEYNSQKAEGLMLWRYGQVLTNGYGFPIHDFNLYCALLIKHKGLENFPEKFKASIFKDGKLDNEIYFHLLRLKILDNFEINEEEKIFFNALRRVKVDERKTIIKKEISRTTVKGKQLNVINHNNSHYYKELLRLTSAFTDITILDWFIPIVLKYERLIHIFVRHVEETKFADSQTKLRTFFSYKPDEIWTLLKTLINQEGADIKDHFIENRVNHDQGKPELMKQYCRNKNNPILFDGDKFALNIDKNGFIMKFHQI